MSGKSNPATKQFHQSYGPWALVAGASEGLGAAFADALGSRGLNLVLVARRAALMQALAERLSEKYAVQINTLPLDLASPEAASRIEEATKSLEVGLLVYNAAYSVVGAFLNRPVEDHMREVDTNVRTPLRLVEIFGKRMLQAGHGGIILMTSLSAFQGSAYVSTYSATKAFNIVLAEGLWEEWRREGVDVLACIAGATRTPNYLASSPRKTNRISDSTLLPETVVSAALAALGRGPTVIPGVINRLGSTVMNHLLSRRAAVSFMGSILRKMYVHEESTQQERKT
jgi:short-subunit dehydrogenase